VPKAELKGHLQLEVIDIYQQPKLARANQIGRDPDAHHGIPTAGAPVSSAALANITGLFVELDLITKGKIAL